MELKDRINAVKERIQKACKKSSRNPSDITILGITKSQSEEAIIESLKLGIRHIGESYVQEALAKIESIKMKLSEDCFKSINWHFVGGLQTNKVKYLKNDFSFIHSVDSIKLLNEIHKRIKSSISIFFELNLGKEGSKKGLDKSEIKDLIKHYLSISRIRQKESLAPIKALGLMCLPPFHEDAELSRPYFRDLRTTLTELNEEFKLNMNCLSMGMSNDFELAIEEGASHIRLGTILYGERS